MRDPIRDKDAQFPERILNKLLRDYVEGRLGNSPPIQKASVLQVDIVGASIAGPDTDRPDEPPNPRNSVLARVITDSADRYTPDEQLPVFWPLFTHDVLPIKEGEHVYVIFEDLEQTHGFWLGRVPEPKDIHNLNLTPGTKRYTEDSDNDLEEATAAAEKIVQDTESDPEVAQPQPEFISEVDDVPEYNQRVGDRIIQGSNNTTIILSRDRVDAIDSGEEALAGTIDIVAGRAGEDVSMADDAARVYVSMKTDADGNFSTPGDYASEGPTSFVVAKADEIRIVARQGVKVVAEAGSTHMVMDSDGNIIVEAGAGVDVHAADEIKVVSDANIVLEGAEIHLNGSDDHLVKSNALKDVIKTVCKDILGAAVVDVAGIPGIGVVNSAVGGAVGAAIDGLWDTTVKSEKNKLS